jgi:hypothetical protein
VSDDGLPCSQPFSFGPCVTSQGCVFVTEPQCAAAGGDFQDELGECVTHLPPAGDMNCDGLVSLLDIDPFIQALMDPAGYAASYPSCNSIWADMNGDGLVNGLDIQGFVRAILGA